MQHDANWIAFSGGLDSSILGQIKKDQDLNAMTIIAKDFIGTDLSDIAKKYFTEIEVKQIHWKTQTTLAPAKAGKQKELGNYENLYLFKKTT